MPTINQLPVLNVISSGDQLPVYSPNNGDARRTSIGSLLTFFQQSFASPTMAVNLFVPGAGFNLTVPTPVAEQQWMLLQPASTLATGTITLPLNTGVPDGTELLISSTQEITAFAIALNGASAVFGAVTTLSAGAAVRFRYYDPTNSWYNIVSDLSVSSVGDVNGPASSTDNAITRFDLTTGKLIQNSLATLADDGAIVAPQAGSVIPFYFANQAAFPSAATYHGAVAHSHADGAMYYAHAGAWKRLVGETVQLLSGSGAVDVINLATSFTSTGTGNALTLANGAQGQLKTIVYVAEYLVGDTGILTPANLGSATTITFNAIGDAVTLQYLGTDWWVVGLRGAVVA